MVKIIYRASCILLFIFYFFLFSLTIMELLSFELMKLISWLSEVENIYIYFFCLHCLLYDFYIKPFTHSFRLWYLIEVVCLASITIFSFHIASNLHSEQPICHIYLLKYNNVLNQNLIFLYNFLDIDFFLQNVLG